MPQAPERVELPQTRGRDAQVYMESLGWVAQTPTIRSSDYNLIGRSPFLYYLTRRLGMVTALSWSKALNRGTWAHVRFEAMRFADSAVAGLFDVTLKKRVDELRGICKTLGVGDEKTLRILHRENHDAQTAWAWVNASCKYKHPGMLSDGWLGLFRQDHWMSLGRELLMSCVDPSFPKTPLLIQVDNLMLNKAKNTLWVMDLKTTSDPAFIRAQFCPVEFQTRLYMNVIKNMLDSGKLQEHFKLPADVKLGGMMHLIIGKPTIEFGTKDRPFHWLSLSKRNGLTGVLKPFKGEWMCEIVTTEDRTELEPAQVFSIESEGLAYMNEKTGKKPEKQYAGEPSAEFYQKRCENWYTGQGDYADKYDERQTPEGAPVVVSFTDAAEILDDDTIEEYHGQLEDIYRYATCVPQPRNFARSSDGMKKGLTGLNSFAPFFTAKPRHWGEIIEDGNFIQRFREEETEGKELVHDTAESISNGAQADD